MRRFLSKAGRVEATFSSAPVDTLAEFAHTRTNVSVASLIGAVLYLVFVFSGIAKLSVTLIVGGFLLLVVFVGYVLVVYRCPSCGIYPGRGFMGWPVHCQNCGVQLAGTMARKA